MKRELLDTLPVGMLGGIASALLGYVILGTAWGWVQDESLAYFHREVFWGSPLDKDRIASRCVLSIVPAFHTAYKRKWDQFARGTMLIMVLMVIAIVYFQYGE